MKNCLVTRLKADVNNPDLEYFDALQFKIDWTNYRGGDNIILFNGNTKNMNFGGLGVTIKVLSNGKIIPSDGSPEVSQYTVPSSWDNITGYKTLGYIDSTKPTEFLLIGLSKITNLKFNYLSKDGENNGIKVALRDPSKLKYCVNLEASERDGVYEVPVFRPYPENNLVDISDYLAGFKDRAIVSKIMLYDNLPGSSSKVSTGTHGWKDYVNLTSIDRNIATIYGPLSNFSSLTELKHLSIGLTGRTEGVIGNITDVVSLVNAVDLNFNNTSVVGSLNEFAVAQYAEGRKTASIKVYGNKLTYLDGEIVKKVTTEGVTLSWADDGAAPAITIVSN